MLQPKMDRNESPLDVDDEVIARAISGDKDSMTAIYDAYARCLYRYFYCRVMNVMDAEDLLAQTFLKVLETLPRYRHNGRFTAWIFQIARNKAIDHFRCKRSTVTLDENIIDHSDANNVLESVVKDQNVEKLQKLLRSLNKVELELLRLRFVADLSYVDIATLLGRKGDAVRKSIQRILGRLYGQMELQMEVRNAQTFDTN